MPGLIDQLEYEGYSLEASEWAVTNIEVDWLEQAANNARTYLDYSAFSDDGLRDQLAFEEFTPEQVEFTIGVMKNQGLV